MANKFTKLNVGDAIVSSGSRVWKMLSTEAYTEEANAKGTTIIINSFTAQANANGTTVII